MPLIIAVDGPAAAGKGTLAKALAETLALPYLDTGLLYRAVARRMLQSGLNPQVDDGTETAEALEPADLRRTDLRVPEIDHGASAVARQQGVRAALLDRQRDFARQSGGVVDGRDIGTVVFPDASVKLYVTASARTRALRRFRQIHGDADISSVDLEKLIAEINTRDQQDQTRDVSPLRQAEDAVVVETDEMDSQAVLDHVLAIVRRRAG